MASLPPQTQESWLGIVTMSVYTWTMLLEVHLKFKFEPN